MALAATSLRAPAFLRWRQERWPRTFSARWAFRAVLSLPYVALADFANHVVGASVANRTLHVRAASLHWTGGQLGWVAHAYPPLPLTVARFFPGGAEGLAIAGALCTGTLIQLTIERLILRSVPTTTAVLLTAAVGATPVFCYLSTGDFSAFFTLSLLSVAMTGLLDFTFNRSTESGFIAGIGFGLATLCDLAAVSFAVAGALAALLVTPQAGAVREIARRRAAAAVVFFPSAAALTGWMFVQWRFSGSWTRSFRLAEPGLFRFPGGAWPSLVRAASVVGHDLAFAPVLVVGGVFLFTRRPSSLLAAAVLVGCVVADLWAGTGLSPAAVVVLLGVVGLVLIPERPTPVEQSVLWVVVGLQLAAAVVGLHYGLGSVAHWVSQLAAGA